MAGFISLVYLICLSLVSCATSTSDRTEQIFAPESPESQAEGAAYTGSAMFYRKLIPSRPDWRPLEFYYKHCTLLGEGSYYSKTSYECTGPY